MYAEPVGPVLVGVDGSESALRAVDLAAEEAAARPSPLVVVHVPGDAGADGGLLQVAATRALAEHPGLAVSTALATGDPADVLATWSQDACLLVLGHHRDLSFPALPAGPVTTRVVYQSACPVIVHRPVDADRETAQPRPVVVGVDGDPRGEPAVEFAFEEAALRGAPLHAVHVRPWKVPDTDRTPFDAVDAWYDKYPEVPVRRYLRYGRRAVPTLAMVSADAQLLVVSADRCDRAPTRVVRGLVPRAMIDLAGCPVAVVPLH
ncbi:universal stress protein [Actinomycetes bacterium KLBMP 9797]